MSKVAFVLSGGGAKGAFQVGALQRLAEKGVVPDVVFGTSVGAINAAGLAYVGINQLTKTWLDIKGRGDILSARPWNLLFGEGFYSMAPLRKKLEENTQGPAVHEAVVCYVNLETGAIHYASNKDMSIDQFRVCVEASAAIPAVMELPQGVMADGGVREQAPLREAIKAGCDTIYLLLCNPISDNPTQRWKNDKFPKIVHTAMRALDVMEHEVFVNDIHECDENNALPGYRKIDLKVYAPDQLLIDTLEFDPEKIRAAMHQGRESVV